jgi:hypothetical protein
LEKTPSNAYAAAGYNQRNPIAMLAVLSLAQQAADKGINGYANTEMQNDIGRFEHNDIKTE